MSQTDNALSDTIAKRDELLLGESIDWDSRTDPFVECNHSDHAEYGPLSFEAVRHAAEKNWITTKPNMPAVDVLLRRLYSIREDCYSDGDLVFEVNLSDGTTESTVEQAAWIDGFVFEGTVNLSTVGIVAKMWIQNTDDTRRTVRPASLIHIPTLEEDVEPDEHQLRFWWD